MFGPEYIIMFYAYGVFIVLVYSLSTLCALVRRALVVLCMCV